MPKMLKDIIMQKMESITRSFLFYRISISILFMFSVGSLYIDIMKYIVSGMLFMLIILMLIDMNYKGKKIK